MSSRRLQRFLLFKTWSIDWKILGWLLLAWIGVSCGLARAKEMPILANLTGNLPLYFVSDEGQPEGKAAYHTLSDGNQAYFTSTGIWLTQKAQHKDPEAGFPAELQRVALQQNPRQRWALKLEFLEAREVTPQASAPTGMKVNYFRGRSSEWRSGVATYGELVYANLWSGVDLHYSGEKGRLKSTFTVKPGADPRRIQLAWRGAQRVALTDAGRLRVETPLGIIEEEQPIAWQERANQRMPVSVEYAVETDTAGGWRYGFKLGEYDPALPLVIDPVTLGYSLVFGPDVSAQGIAVDRTGAAYITGIAKRASFPPTSGVITESEADKWGIFIAKLKPDGSGLVYVTFLDDSDNKFGFSAAIAVDEKGAAYVTGMTFSDKFPIVGNALGTVLKGANDAFVAKINPDGSTLVYAGLLGGSNSDEGKSIAVDTTGAAYITGTTSSNDFPTVGNLGVTLNGNSAAFVAKIQPDGAGLAYAGYLSGNGTEGGTGIAVDKTGAAYITGNTSSSNFPVSGGLGAVLEGYSDAFVAKVKPDGSGLAYAGYLGGSSATGIAVDSAGAAYVTGSGDYKQFPAVAGFNRQDNHQLFIAKVQPEGLGLAYVGFVGGYDLKTRCGRGGYTCSDGVGGIAVDVKGAAYVTGFT